MGGEREGGEEGGGGMSVRAEYCVAACFYTILARSFLFKKCPPEDAFEIKESSLSQ